MTTTEISTPAIENPSVEPPLAEPSAAPSTAPPSPGRSAGPVPAQVARGLSRALRNIGWLLAGSAVVIAVWQVIAGLTDGLPTPLDSARTLGVMLADPFYDNGPNDKGVGIQLSISLQRVFAGFLLAALVGIPAGLLLGSVRPAWMAFNPIVQVLRPVSPLAWYPIWLVVFKDPPPAAIFVIFITALWPTLINTAAGVADIPQDQRNVARVFRFGTFAYLRHVLVPNALPSIITGLRVSMGIGWMVIVAVEMLSGNTGIGFFIWDSYNSGRLDFVVASIVLIGLTGFIIDSALLWLSRRVAIEGVQS
jgi:nitrate/nitrite transport system permease protein